VRCGGEDGGGEAYAESGAARQKGRREEGRWSAAGDREAKGIAIYAAALSLSAAARGLSFNVLCFCLLPDWLCLFPSVPLALGYAGQGRAGQSGSLCLRYLGRRGRGRGEGRTGGGSGATG